MIPKDPPPPAQAPKDAGGGKGPDGGNGPDGGPDGHKLKPNITGAEFMALTPQEQEMYVPTEYGYKLKEPNN
jgi:hypothetical protein